ARIVGGTGTDGTPIIIGIAKFMDILTTGLVTSPLSCNTKLQYAYPWWKEKVIDSDLKRKDGLCPLTHEIEDDIRTQKLQLTCLLLLETRQWQGGVGTFSLFGNSLIIDILL
ncbi:hypothetical protein ACJX0J_034091, partial [Zea mays]